MKFTTSKNLHNCMKAVVAQETTVMLNATVMLIWMLNATVMLDENILRRQRRPQVRQAMNMEETGYE